MKPSTLPYQQGTSTSIGNRANEIRRDDDVIKIPKITLYDIDYAIYYHLNDNVKPRVVENGISIPVPVQFANGEKWSQIRSNGFLRDGNKKIQAPLIILRRNDVSADERLNFLSTNTFGPNVFTPKGKILPYRTSNMQYDRTAGQYLSKDSYEFYIVDVPDYCRVTYDLIIWTDLIEQMNTIVQNLIPLSDHVWGDYHKFRTKIMSITHDNINAPGEDRIIKTNISLQVDGYLRNEYEYHGSKIQKAYSLKRVDFLNETTDEIIYEQDPPSNQYQPPFIQETFDDFSNTKQLRKIIRT